MPSLLDPRDSGPDVLTLKAELKQEILSKCLELMRIGGKDDAVSCKMAGKLLDKIMPDITRLEFEARSISPYEAWREINKPKIDEGEVVQDEV